MTKPGYLTLAVVSLAAGVATVAVVSSWWRFLLLLAVLGACAVVPVAHTVFGPAEGGR